VGGSRNSAWAPDGECFVQDYKEGSGLGEGPAAKPLPGQAIVEVKAPEADRRSLFQCPKECKIWPIVRDFLFSLSFTTNIIVTCVFTVVWSWLWLLFVWQHRFRVGGYAGSAF